MNEDYDYGFEDGHADAHRGQVDVPKEDDDYRRGYLAGVAAFDQEAVTI